MHDVSALNDASRRIEECADASRLRDLICGVVDANERWRGRQCLNLVAAESPTSNLVRKLLSSEVGIRASGGHIGRQNRFFVGMDFVDELEAICIQMLKRLLHSKFADHRLLGGMISCLVAYTSLTDIGDRIMSVPVHLGGDTSNRANGPPGVRGLEVVDLPFDPNSCSVDLNRLYEIGRKLRPRVVGIGMTIALFPFPIREIRAIVDSWGGYIYFDAAHQLGLISGEQFPNPLDEGADVLTGSTGKTFSGPQGGAIFTNNAVLAQRITDTIFPVLTGSHQINRVAALALAAAEQLAYGKEYMKQVVLNARHLASSLEKRDIRVLHAERGYTETHQLMIDAAPYGGGEAVVRRLEQANIITNKMPLPQDGRDEHVHESGVRLGTVEVTRLGMKEPEMDRIAEMIASSIQLAKPCERLRREIIDFRSNYNTLFYCHDHPSP